MKKCLQIIRITLLCCFIWIALFSPFFLIAYGFTCLRDKIQVTTYNSLCTPTKPFNVVDRYMYSTNNIFHTEQVYVLRCHGFRPSNGEVCIEDRRVTKEEYSKQRR